MENRQRAMTSARVVASVLCVLWAAAAASAQVQAPATVREYKKIFRTYPYSDPNPLPVFGRIYPYYRFDLYTDQAIDKAWTVVELENAFLRVLILPEIGGKIWTAIEKSTGRPFIYHNEVVKFRDIAMRGPWTSGGIEANYGIIGHTPNCATPVDYVTHRGADGSASVTIGVLDLLTRTPWRLEIALPADKAYFTTRSFWFNASPLEQPYYTWMNAGLEAAGNLQFVYPGTHYLGHDGEHRPWPRHATNGRDLSFYDQNDFGGYKSYHVFGQYTDFFGAYWHDHDFGMARYSERGDKPGKKIWIWGLSPQGMIWERLLTDTNGQYVEVQSGRLFNQAAEGSSRTPFKHRGFDPAATDTWTEYWLPVKGTKGFVQANDLGALNVRHDAGRLTVSFSPAQRVDDLLEVFDGDTRVFSTPLALAPLQPWTKTLDRDIEPARLVVRVGRTRLVYHGDPKTLALSRPVESPAFDWESAVGLHQKGRELMRQRLYVDARPALDAALAKDPMLVPALTDLAQVRYRVMDFQGAFDLTRRALAIDTYDPAANYYYGLAATRLGRRADARDGFEIAAQSAAFRGAAWVQLARLSAQDDDLARARRFTAQALEVNRTNLEALHLEAVVARLAGDRPRAAAASAQMLALDPLNHAARAEEYLADRAEAAGRAFTAAIRNEMPHETFLELAAWYDGLGRAADAAAVLALAPEATEVLYWRAYLASRTGAPDAAASLARAHAASPSLVFPFRPESAAVFEWAAQQGDSWQPTYYLALLRLGLGDVDRARTLLEQAGNTPTYAPFYVARAQAFKDAAPDRSLADLLRAESLDPTQWRIGRLLVERYVELGDLDRALAVARRTYEGAPANYIAGMLYAKALVLTRRYQEATTLLDRLQVLPYEGATEARRLYREAYLMRAVDALRGPQAGQALDLVERARLWPPGLGSGKPYPADVDERLEDYLRAQALARTGRGAEGRQALGALAVQEGAAAGAGAMAAALAARDVGRGDRAEALLAAWRRGQPPEALAWAREILAGRPAPLPEALAADEGYRVLSAWLGSGSGSPP